MTMLKLREMTAAQWTAGNPILRKAEMGLETDTGNIKLGNGSTPWTGLPYSGDMTGDKGATGDKGPTGDQGPVGDKGPDGDAAAVQVAAAPPVGAPTGAPFAYDTTAVTGGFYFWDSAQWVKVATIL